METSLTTQLWKQTSWFGGIAMSVQRARCTSGMLAQLNEIPLEGQQGALFVLGINFVSATLWRLFVPILLLTSTVTEMVSVPLKWPIHQAQSTAGCQTSLEPSSALCFNARLTQKGRLVPLVDAPESMQRAMPSMLLLTKSKSKPGVHRQHAYVAKYWLLVQF